MATNQINTNIRQARYGRLIFAWDDGTDDSVVNFRIDDSLEVNEGGHARHPYDYNNNTLVAIRREGRPQPSAIRFRAKRSDLSGDNELRARMLDADAGDGIVPEFTFKLEMLDGNGVTTGEMLTFANCTFAGGFSFSEAENMDEVTVEIECPHPSGELTTF